MVNDLSNNFQVLGDENQIRTVLRNLLNNAVKFSHRGGQINISQKMYNSFVSLEISDNGIGILEEDLVKIFYSPKIKMGTSGEKGTGFVLFLCKELIEKNGGNIEINSNYGVGTTIKIVLLINI